MINFAILDIWSEYNIKLSNSTIKKIFNLISYLYKKKNDKKCIAYNII